MSRPESYFVVSNPYPVQHSDLHVLFTGSSQTKLGHKLGPKVFDYHLVHHIIAGKGTFICHGQEYKLGVGDSFFIEPEQLVSYAADEADPWQYRWLAFQGNHAAGLLHSVGINATQPIVHTGKRRNIAALFHQIQTSFRTKKESSHLKAIGYLHLLLSEYSDALHPTLDNGEKTESEIEKTIKQAIHYLSTQYAEAITIEMMAESLGYNRAYLSKLFKLHTQLTPVTFLLHLRLDKARQLLRERMELTTQQIASSVGFQDPLYFSKQFKKMYDQSPTEYRNKIKSL